MKITYIMVLLTGIAITARTSKPMNHKKSGPKWLLQERIRNNTLRKVTALHNLGIASKADEKAKLKEFQEKSIAFLLNEITDNELPGFLKLFVTEYQRKMNTGGIPSDRPVTKLYLWTKPENTITTLQSLFNQSLLFLEGSVDRKNLHPTLQMIVKGIDNRSISSSKSLIDA